MLWNLDIVWIALAIATVSIFGFMLGTALDGLMGEDGFGAAGNMLIITSGFFLAVYLANSWGVRLNDLTMAVGTGLGGAFVVMLVLALAKGVLGRIMR
ncbi:MAG: hypothetical protein Q8Q62_21715 [Mesorhizobium sp.]|nr:hypothetical protein [Mesorhizobium sp.]